MVAKNQHPDEFYLQIADAYRSGILMKQLMADFRVAKNTVYRAIRMHAVDERRPKPEPTAPSAVPAPTFDRFAELPMVPCECGTCGGVFKRTIGQRTRRFAKGCPNRPNPHGKKPTPKPLEARQGRGRDAATVGRAKVKICPVCCNLAHARAHPVCVDAWVTHSGKRIFAKGCGLPAERTPSLGDHDMVKRCGAFLAPLASEE